MKRVETYMFQRVSSFETYCETKRTGCSKAKLYEKIENFLLRISGRKYEDIFEKDAGSFAQKMTKQKREV